METPVPPQLPSPNKRKTSAKKTILLILVLCVVAFFLMIIVPMITGLIFGTSMMAGALAKMSHLEIKSSVDTFQLKVLEVKIQPNYFMERVSVRCSEDMDAGIWVTDLKKAGIFETVGTNGETIYREGEPYGIGQSMPIHAKNGFFTTEIIFQVTTTATNTIWHSESGGSTCDTTLSTPFTVSNIQTNWPSSYQRHTDIPLASLGDSKILLAIK